MYKFFEKSENLVNDCNNQFGNYFTNHFDFMLRSKM